MNKKRMNVMLVGCSLALLFFGYAGPARAQTGLDACGNIWLEADAHCEFEPPGIQCKTRCEPLYFEASCAAELSVDCQAGCTVDITTELPQCQTTCETECEKDPPAFDCRTNCEFRCGGSCSGKCSGSTSSGGHCEASCKASCGLNCDTECRELPPTETCVTKCEHSCTGSLQAEMTVDCQASCQADGFVDCEARVKGGCETACDTQDGALFCDGQFIDQNNNLEKCIDALKNLKFYVSAEGEVSVGCSMSQPDRRVSFLGALLPLVLIPLFSRRRRWVRR